MTASRVSFWTRRRDGGVTIGPISTRSVAHAIALSVTHGSAHPRTGGE